MTEEIEDVYDVIILGAGAGGMAAASVAANEGLKTLIIEKTEYVGGTTSYSGGMCWIPNTEKRHEVEAQDSIEQAQKYLEAVANSSTGTEKRQHFLKHGPEALEYLDHNTEVKLTPVKFYPDYYPDMAGSTCFGRVLEPLAFDARKLGKDFKRLRPPLAEFTLFGGMMISRSDIPSFQKCFRSLSAMLRVLKLTSSYIVQRIQYHRGTHLVLGNALAARLLKSLQNLQVPIITNCIVHDLVITDGRVSGIEIEINDKRKRLSATHGVVLATGGFSHDQAMRGKYLPKEAGFLSATAPGGTGDGIKMGKTAGGFLPADGNDAYWVPVSKLTRQDGTQGIYPHTVTDRGKPGFLAVNQDGCRFTNESDSYHEFVRNMFSSRRKDGATSTWLLCDAQSLWDYGLGGVKPRNIGLKHLLATGHIHQDTTLDKLARKIGVNSENLRNTIEQYNQDSITGTDQLFGRGRNAYHKYLGDPANTPNPCMRPIMKAPYYAVQLFPGDLGTATGLNTNKNTQVLGANGKIISGLYACGNDMDGIMAGSYPGPGITLGPALVFGYLAGMHLAKTKSEQ